MSRPAVTAVARVHRSAGAFFAWWGWHGAAQQALRDAVRAQPEWAEARLALADSLGRRGRWNEASDSLRHVVRLAPRDPEAHGLLVLALGRAGRWAEAVRALDVLIRVRPHDAETHLLRGALLRKAGQPAEALRALRWAVRLPPGPTWNRFFLGELLLGPREWSQTLSAYGCARSLDAGAPPPRYRVGSALNGHPGDALLGNVAASERLDRRRRARRRLALAARVRRASSAVGRFAHRGAASLQLHAGILVFGRRPHWMLRALRAGRPVARSGATAATAALSVLLTVAGTSVLAETPAARERARECARSVGAPAVEACQAALDLGLGPERAAVTLRVLATELSGLERWDEMVEAYRALVRLRPEDADARYRLGAALLEVQHQPEAALRELDRAVELDPQRARAHAARAAALNALGRHDQALAEFETVEGLDPDYFARHPASAQVRDASGEGRVWP